MLSDSIDLKTVIKNARRKKGLNQKDVAEALDVSQQTVGFWETGRSTPRGTSRLRALAKVLDISPEELGVDPYPWDEKPFDTSNTQFIGNNLLYQRKLAEALRRVPHHGGATVIPVVEGPGAITHVEPPAFLRKEHTEAAEKPTGTNPADVREQLRNDVDNEKGRWAKTVSNIRDVHDRRERLGSRYRTAEESAAYIAHHLPKPLQDHLMGSLNLKGAIYKYTYLSNNTVALVMQTGLDSRDRLSLFASTQGRTALYRLSIAQRIFDDVQLSKHHYVLFLEGSYTPPVLEREAQLFDIKIETIPSLQAIAERLVGLETKQTDMDIYMEHISNAGDWEPGDEVSDF